MTPNPIVLPQQPLAVQWLKVDIAGAKIYARKHINTWEIGQVFNVKPEPDNQYDPRAIALYLEETKIGFIDKNNAQTLYGLFLEDWSISHAYLTSPKDGKFKEGVLTLRLVNPILGWENYHPFLSFSENKARFEHAQLTLALSQSLQNNQTSDSTLAPAKRL